MATESDFQPCRSSIESFLFSQTLNPVPAPTPNQRTQPPVPRYNQRNPCRDPHKFTTPTTQLNNLNDSAYHTSVTPQDNSWDTTLNQPNCSSQLYSHQRAPLTGHLTPAHSQGHLYYPAHCPSASLIQLPTHLPLKCHRSTTPPTTSLTASNHQSHVPL